jgi:multiple antibiotic resistance protein
VIVNWSGLFEEFVTIWVVVDPIGTLPVFLAVTAGMEPRLRKRIAIKAIVTAAAILLFFLVCGQLLIEALGISLLSFQISGGIILFLFALTMIFGSSKPQSEMKLGAAGDGDLAIFPLAVPSIAGPGAMLAVVLLTDNHRFSLVDQSLTSVVMLAVLALTLVLLLLANPIHRLIRESGASIVSRVMGMILAAVAADTVLEGLEMRFMQP